MQDEDTLDPLHLELLAWVAGQLQPEHRQDFVGGFNKRSQHLQDVVSEVLDGRADLLEAKRAQTDLLTWVRSWTVSVKLCGDDEWQRDMKEADVAMGAGNVEFTGEQELQALLRP